MDRLNVLGMVIDAPDLNLTLHSAFMFFEDRFLVFLCAKKKGCIVKLVFSMCLLNVNEILAELVC